MAETKRKPKAKPKKVRRPGAIVPPKLRPFFGRPTGGSPVQRMKRRSKRGNDKPGNLIWNQNGSAGELILFGTIGADFFGEGVTAQNFNDGLKALGGVSDILLRVNSGGGDVFEATAIYNMLVKHPANVRVEIEGVAASAATLISMAGDEIRISENAHFMVHAASGIAWGTAEELRQYLKLLDNADQLIRLTFAKRTGISDGDLRQMLSFDNWMTAQEALDQGFVDAIDEAKEVTPHVTEDQPEAAYPHGPITLTSDRLTEMSDELLSLAASVGYRVAASAKGSSPSTPKEPEKMNAKLREKCVAAGMSENLDDAAAQKWFDEHVDDVLEPKQTATAVAEPPKKPEDTGGNPTTLTLDSIADYLDAREKRAVEARKAFRGEVDATLEVVFDSAEDVPSDLREKCYALQEEGLTAVRNAISEHKKSATQAIDQVTGSRINLSKTQPRDRHVAAVRAGLLVRAFSGYQSRGPRYHKFPDGTVEQVTVGPSDILDKYFPEKDRPKDWESFSRVPLLKIAEECLVIDGFDADQVRRLSAPEAAMAALGYHRSGGLRAEAIHTTGSLPEITRDAVNKSLLAGYEEAPQTWRGPMRQGASVADFKDKHVIKLSAAPNLPIWVDNKDPEQVKLSDEKEKYAVEARAEMISFSWKLIVNDDMDAISRRPQLVGDAAGRTVNAVAWAQVTANPTLADGQAFFLETPAGNRKRSNLTTGSATPTNSTIGAMKAKMRVMRGLNTPEGNESDDILNLMPAFLVGPAALEELILKQVFSGADPASGGNSAVFNTSRTLEPIIEPLLDANSENAWYLFASPNRIDTIEVTFLQGQETPFTLESMDDKNLSQNFLILQSFAAKAIDYRGVQKHDGE